MNPFGRQPGQRTSSANMSNQCWQRVASFAVWLLNFKRIILKMLRPKSFSSQSKVWNFMVYEIVSWGSLPSLGSCSSQGHRPAELRSRYPGPGIQQVVWSRGPGWKGQPQSGVPRLKEFVTLKNHFQATTKFKTWDGKHSFVIIRWSVKADEMLKASTFVCLDMPWPS